MVTLTRLQKTDPQSWVLWPQFEARVRAFQRKMSPHFTADQESRYINELQARWVNQPLLAGYWLIRDGEKAVGHITAWVQDTYGVPYVLCHQVECDEIWEAREMLRQAIYEARVWIDGMNGTLGAQGLPRISYIEQWTTRSAEAWKRFMPELQHDKEYTVMRIKL